MDQDVATQLSLFGLQETRRMAEVAASKSVRARQVNLVESAHALLSEMPSAEDLGFLHSGLCQTGLPHMRPARNHAFWKRQSGRFTLLVTPGVIDTRSMGGSGRQPTDEEMERAYVGVPYGPKARLIMIFLQTEGMKSQSRVIPLGPSLSAFLRSLNLSVSGGPRGTMPAVREQCMRIARCTFTLQWTGADAGGEHTVISDTKIVEGLEMWNNGRDDWSGTVELSKRFHEHLREHAVPLDKRGISILSGNSLGLDLYALFAYRLPRLKRELHLSWAHLREQIGSECETNKAISRRVREAMPGVKLAYPHARVELTRHGISMRESPPAVPRTMVRGFTPIEGDKKAD